MGMFSGDFFSPSLRMTTHVNVITPEPSCDVTPFQDEEVNIMQKELRTDLNVSNCPKCGTRLMCGKIIVTGLQKCPKCNRHWVIHMEKDKMSVVRASVHFGESS